MSILVIEHAVGRADGIAAAISANHDVAHVWRPYTTEEEPTLSDFHGLIVGGGPMGTYDLDRYPFFKKELSLIERAVGSIPVLGVCLGAQLLAHVGGGEVKKTDWRRGWFEIELVRADTVDPLFRGCDARFTTFQWHQDEVVRLPRGASLLAKSDNCPVEAFRFDGHPVWGVQAHLEVTLEKAHQIFADSKPILAQDTHAGHLERPTGVRSSSNAILLKNFCNLIRSAPVTASGER